MSANAAAAPSARALGISERFSLRGSDDRSRVKNEEPADPDAESEP
jgi:hypothetical protein